MVRVKTVFSIGLESYTVDAVGQEAVKAIRREFKKSQIFLIGFYVNDKYIPVNLN